MWRPALTAPREVWLRPAVADALLAAALTASTFVTLATGTWGGIGPPGPYRPPDVVSVLLYLGQGVPIAARRRFPLAVLAVVGAAYALDSAAGLPSVPANVGLLVALYTAGAYARGRWGIVAAVILSLGVVAGDHAAMEHASGRRQDVDFVAVVFLVTGLVQRGRRAYVRRLEQRADWLEQQRREAERAVAEERARIARELHDVVTHNVTAMVVAADGAHHLLGDGSRRAGPVLDAIGATGRQALTELRQLLGVLHSGVETADGTAATLPGLDRLDDLVAQVRQAGQEVDLRVQGQRRRLPAAVELSAYRIVQEALTNVVRHAGGHRARVLVRYGVDRLDVEVVNDGPVMAGAAAEHRAGHGLAGMRERVGVFGGRLRAGPREGGGFEVVATLPVEGAGT